MSKMLPPSSENGHLPEAYRAGGYAAGSGGPGMMGPPAGPAGGGDLGLKRYISALYRHKWMILGITVLGTALGFGVTRFMQPVYNVSAQIFIEQPVGGPAAPIRSGQLLARTGWTDLIRSPTVLDSVIRRERLYLEVANASDSLLFANFVIPQRAIPGRYTLAHEPATNTLTLSTEAAGIVSRAPVGAPIGSEVGISWTPPGSRLARGRSVEFRVRAPVDVMAELQRDLQPSLPEDGQFMTVRLRGTDPVRITRTVNAVLDRFEEVATLLKTQRLQMQTEILQSQVARSQMSLEAAEQALKEFEINTVTMPTDRVLTVPTGLATTDNSAISEYFTLTSRREQLREDMRAIERAIANPGPAIVTALELVPSVRGNSLLSQALAQAAQSEAGVRSLLAQFTPEYRPVQQAQAQLDTLRQQTIPLLARQLIAEMETQLGDVTAEIASAGTELRSIPERRIRQGQLTRNVGLQDQIYRDLDSRLHSARLAEMTAAPDITILTRPDVPYTPVLDERSRMLLMFFGGSLGLALMGAILRDRFDPRVRYPDEITGRMGLNILGAVPALRGGKVGSTDMALAVEAFRAIQLSLVHAHGADAPLMVTFTSPGASDGKSFVTSNLAIAFADMGHRTLVIDGDVRRGSQHQLMGTSHKPGLTDFLAGKASRAEVVQHTRYPMLDLLPCGSRGETGPKLLGSPAMGRLIEDLRADYDVILVDSPPLGACVDPMILGTLTRNLVLVLRTGTTDRAMAESKLDILDRLPVRVLGAVLNDVTASGPYRYYSYISGYEVIEEIEEGREVKALEEPTTAG